jgi:hypothetical protein
MRSQGSLSRVHDSRSGLHGQFGETRRSDAGARERGRMADAAAVSGVSQSASQMRQKHSVHFVCGQRSGVQPARREKEQQLKKE